MCERECDGDDCCGCACPPEENDDGRVSVTINFPDRDFLLDCFLAAHEADMTFNDWVAEAVRAHIQTLPVLEADNNE